MKISGCLASMLALLTATALFPSVALADHIQVMNYGCDPTSVAPLKSAPQFVICAECGDTAEQTAERQFRRKYPKVHYERFSATGIPGVYEVARAIGVVYYSPPDYLFIGELLKGGKSLTKARRTELISATLKNLPLDSAIKIGTGPNIVVEFSDPDCPFCRSASAWMKARKDITRYVFLFPLESIHPNAVNKSQLILCAADPAREYERAMSGGLDGKANTVPQTCAEKAEMLLAASVRAGRRLGVRFTPSYWVNGERVSGANIPMIDKLLTMENKNEQ